MSPEVTLHERLDQIRTMQGKEPLPSPHKIQGFGANDPPPPPLGPRAVEFDPDVPPEWLNNEVDQPEKQPQVSAPPLSPLIPQVNRPAMSPVGGDLLSKVSLVVIDRLAAWKGQEVQLSADEETAIRRIVHMARKRIVDSDLAAVVPPRKPRASRSPSAERPLDEPTAATPRKRGRPRGSLLKPTL